MTYGPSSIINILSKIIDTQVYLEWLAIVYLNAALQIPPIKNILKVVFFPLELINKYLIKIDEPATPIPILDIPDTQWTYLQYQDPLDLPKELTKAVCQGNSQKVKELLKNPACREKIDNANDLLLAATRNNHYEIFCALMDIPSIRKDFRARYPDYDDYFGDGDDPDYNNSFWFMNEIERLNDRVMLSAIDYMNNDDAANHKFNGKVDPLLKKYITKINSHFNESIGEIVSSYANHALYDKKYFIKMLRTLGFWTLRALLIEMTIKNQGVINDFNDLALMGKMPHPGILFTDFPNPEVSPAQLSPVDAHKLALRIGHLLGLPKDIEIGANREHRFIVKGSAWSSSLNLLSDLLSNYLQSDDLKDKTEKVYFGEIAEAVQFTKQLVINNGYIDHAKDKLAKRYHEGKLIYISTGWPKHCVAIALKGNYLVYTNRGDGTKNPFAGTHVFELKDKNLITGDTLAKLLKDAANAQEFLALLNELIGKELFSFPAKAQEYGTCGFVNPKSSVEGMLVVCENANKDRDNLIRLAKSAAASRTTYKKFTKHVADHGVKEIVEWTKRAKTPQMQEFCVKLIHEIILEHHGKAYYPDSSVEMIKKIQSSSHARSGCRSKEKQMDEQERLMFLLNNLPEPITHSLFRELKPHKDILINEATGKQEELQTWFKRQAC